MINGHNSSWTEPRVGALVGMWITDMTPEAIAAEMGGFEHTSDGGRKAVIGKANRMGLPPKRVKAAQQTAEELEALRLSRRQRQVEREKARIRIRSKSGASPRPKAEPKPEAALFLESLQLLFGELDPRRVADPNQCRFPEGNGPDFLFCGNPTKPGKSYCDHHHAKCHYAGGTAPLSEAERARRSNHGKALGFAAVKRNRVPSLFPVGEISPAHQLADATA